MIRLSILLAGIVLASPLVKTGGAGVAEAQTAKETIDTTITIRAVGSNLEFEVPEIAVKQGKRVKLLFVNAGTLPHNIVFAREDKDVDVLAAAASDAYKTGYVPVHLKDRMIAYSTLASPGQTVEVTFVVPPPGEYTYVCLISGHYNSMLGTLRSLK
jgi:plastocyanin